jgi:nitroimidazol reductase NimA-like FMN-containing flavoprotein (pyridoxamine 5'-phosphate oxidase superfamily)
MDTVKHMGELPMDLHDWRYPIRLAVQSEDEIPRIVSLWFMYKQGSFYCVTHQSAWVLRQLQKHPQVGFEIASNSPPYKGVRGTGKITLSPLQDDLLEQLIARYLNNTDSDLAQWLLSRKAEEVVIKLLPLTISSWDYSRRMAGIKA